MTRPQPKKLPLLLDLLNGRYTSTKRDVLHSLSWVLRYQGFKTGLEVGLCAAGSKSWGVSTAQWRGTSLQYLLRGGFSFALSLKTIEDNQGLNYRASIISHIMSNIMSGSWNRQWEPSLSKANVCQLINFVSGRYYRHTTLARNKGCPCGHQTGLASCLPWCSIWPTQNQWQPLSNFRKKHHRIL